MQETQYGIKLAEEDTRWMTFAGLAADANLNSVLTPLPESLVGPSSLDATPQTSSPAQSELGVALVNVSLDINTLVLEQVRLRETLETLNSTLFITGASLAGNPSGVTGSDAKKASDDKAPATDAPVTAAVKWARDALIDSAKTKASDKVIEGTLGKLPFVGEIFKGDSKGDHGCCPDVTEALRGRERYGPKKPRPGRPGRPRMPRSTNTTTTRKKTTGFTATLRSVIEKAGKVFEGPRLGFQAGASAQGLPVRPLQPGTLSGSATPHAPVPGKGVGLIEGLERGWGPVPTHAAASSAQPVSTAAMSSAPPVRAAAVSSARPVSTAAVSSAQPVSTAAMSSVQPVSAAAVSSASSATPSVPKVPTAGLVGAMTRLESASARALGPLKYVDTAINVVQGVRDGDPKAVASGLTTAGGAWAGASAGAALGTLVFPGVGTAVGGAIGGLLGSEAGSWLGDKLFGPDDRLPAPNAVSKELNSARTDSVQVTIAPSIQISGVNPADAQQVVNQVIQALQFQCMPMVTDSLGIRRNAALADSGGD